MSYQQYGISSELVERVKWKLKNPVLKERVKEIVHGVSKHDLQNRTKVKKLLRETAAVLGERLTDEQFNQMVRFIIDQKIDPNNALHLLRLWNMFR